MRFVGCLQALRSDAELRKIGDGGRHVHLVGSKNFFTEYDARVTPYNDIGDGPVSKEVTVWSAENSKYLKCDQLYFEQSP